MAQEYPKELEQLIKSIELEFRHIQPGLFSEETFARIRKRADEFTRELVLESLRISKRHQSDSVSPAYVDHAAEHLASGKTATWRRLVGGIGGLVCGVSLATAGTMIQQNLYTTRGVVLSLICIVVGLPAFIVHIVKE